MRRTFNFPKDVDKHLARQDNMTQYIVKLIRQDMENKQMITENDVIRIVENYLENKHSIESKDIYPMSSNEISNSIMDIINM